MCVYVAASAPEFDPRNFPEIYARSKFVVRSEERTTVRVQLAFALYLLCCAYGMPFLSSLQELHRRANHTLMDLLVLLSGQYVNSRQVHPLLLDCDAVWLEFSCTYCVRVAVSYFGGAMR